MRTTIHGPARPSAHAARERGGGGTPTVALVVATNDTPSIPRAARVVVLQLQSSAPPLLGSNEFDANPARGGGDVAAGPPSVVIWVGLGDALLGVGGGEKEEECEINPHTHSLPPLSSTTFSCSPPALPYLRHESPNKAYKTQRRPTSLAFFHRPHPATAGQARSVCHPNLRNDPHRLFRPYSSHPTRSLNFACASPSSAAGQRGKGDVNGRRRFAQRIIRHRNGPQL